MEGFGNIQAGLSECDMFSEQRTALQRVKLAKARIEQLSRCSKCCTSNPHGTRSAVQANDGSDDPDSEITLALAELDAAVNAPVHGNEDPTLWLPNELMILILTHVPLESLWSGACSPCRRWHQLSRSPEVRRRLRGTRWLAYAKKWIQPKTLVGHSGSVRALAVGLDDKVYTGSDDGTVRVWSLNDSFRVPVKVFHCFPSAVSAIAVGHDGKLYTGSQHIVHVRVWSTPSTPPMRLQGHQSGVTALAVGHDGKVYSGSTDTTVRVWSADSGEHLWTLEGHTRAIRALVIATNGRVVSASSDRTIRVWASDNGAHLHTMEGHSHVVCALAVGPNNLVYSSSFDKTIAVWSAADGTRIRRLRYRANRVTALTSDGDRLFSGVWDGTLSIWSCSYENPLLHTAHDGGSVLSLATTRSGRLLCGSGDHTIRVW